MEIPISSLCRCCMQPGCISVFKSMVENIQLAEIMEKYTGQSVFPEDEYPEWICQLCFDNFITWHSFVVRSLEVREKFSEISKSMKLELYNTHVEDIEITEQIQEEEIENDEDKMQIQKQITEEIIIDEKPPALLKTPETNNYKCEKCNLGFALWKDLEKHRKETGHPILKRFKCGFCSKKFLNNYVLNVHCRMHNKEKPYKCDNCDKMFSNVSNLQRHSRTHTGEKPYSCGICEKKFTRRQAMITHMRQHTGEIPFGCKECGKAYKSSAALQFHKKISHERLRVECEICKKSVLKLRLSTHMNAHKQDEIDSQFLCNLCGKTLKSKPSLDNHLNSHTKNILYKCQICRKSFAHPSYLRIHMRIHSGEKPYTCNICDRKFNQHAHLQTHKKIHTGLKPHSCSYCGKSFAVKCNLVAHERIHTGDKPYSCSVCNKGFFDSSSRKKHEVSVHNMHKKEVVMC